MGKLSFCDCTLSACGKKKEFYFGKDNIHSYIEYATDAGVEYYSLGFFRPEVHITGSVYYHNIKDAMKPVSKYKGTKFILQVEMGKEIPADQIEDCIHPELILCINFTKEFQHQAKKYCKELSKKGYSLFIRPLNAERYTQEELLKCIKPFEEYHPLAIYLDNSFGSLDAEQQMEYLAFMDKHLEQRIIIGWHSVNIQGSAFSMLKALCKNPIMHDIILDASLFGVSNYSLLLPLGEAMSIASKQGDFHPDVLEKLPQKNIYMLPLGKSEYQLSGYALAAQYKADPRYVEFWQFERHTNISEIRTLLQRLSKEEIIAYNKKTAEKVYHTFAQKRFSIAVVIPTCNRSATIDYWLFTQAHRFKHYGIDIIIYDSSSNRETEAVVKNFQIDGCDNVIYHHYDGAFDGFSLDTKIIDAYIDYADQYEYLWLCRDGLVITIDSCYQKLKKLVEDKADYIVVDSSFRCSQEMKGIHWYDNCVDFYEDHLQRIVTLGTLILSSKIAKLLVKRYPVNDSNYSLWQMAVPFHYYAKKHNIKAVSYIDDIFAYNLAGTRDSFWNKSSKALRQWSERWYEVVTSMPKIYTSSFNKVIFLDMFDFHPFYLSSLLRIRGNGGLDFHMISRYKKYLEKVSKTPIRKFYLAALIPKSLARLVVYNPEGKKYQKLHKLYTALFINQIKGDIKNAL